MLDHADQGHLGLEKYVAVKEMVPQPELATQRLDQLRDQFKREAVTLARLDHPNLVRVLDSFEEDGNAYLVMDLVEGESLRQGRDGAPALRTRCTLVPGVGLESVEVTAGARTRTARRA